MLQWDPNFLSSPYGDAGSKGVGVGWVHQSVSRPVLLTEDVRADHALGVAPNVGVAIVLVTEHDADETLPTGYKRVDGYTDKWIIERPQLRDTKHEGIYCTVSSNHTTIIKSEGNY